MDQNTGDKIKKPDDSIQDDPWGIGPYTRPPADFNLFASSGHRRHEVIIGGKDNSWDLYCAGYWRAAELLANNVVRRWGKDDYSAFWESQAYAILFLYRHYLELRLKELILAYNGDMTKIADEHRLLSLWKILRELDDSYTGTRERPREVGVDLQTAESVIRQFHELDKNSQAFRYPVFKNSLVTVQPMQIDLMHLKEALGWTAQLLDGWSEGIYQEKQAGH